MSRRKKDDVIDPKYLEWLSELSCAPATQEIRKGVSMTELSLAEQELNEIINELNDPCAQRKLRTAARNAFQSYEKFGFCIGHLSHERGI